MEFIDHDELPALGPKEGIRVIEPAPIGGPLQIQVGRPTRRRSRDAVSKGCLAGLPRTKQHHTGFDPEPLLDHRLLSAD
jgi:hypothetical protein